MDANGAWLAVVVVLGSVQDRDGLQALSGGKQAWPNLRAAVLDAAFTAKRRQAWCNHYGMRRCRVVGRAPEQKGFVVLERRWVVERSCGWLTRGSRLLRDRASRPDMSATRLARVVVLSSVKAVINLSPAHAEAIRTNSNRL